MMNDEMTITLAGAPVASDGPAITIQMTDGGLYSVVEEALRRFTGWFTVTARNLCRAVASRVRAYVRQAVRLNGCAILRRCSILRM